MKTIYKCEKCGQEFDTYEECRMCENSHLIPESIILPDNCDSVVTLDYKRDSPFPDRVTISFHLMDKEGYYCYEDDDHSKPTMIYAEYKLFNATDTYSDTVWNGVAEEQARQAEWWENWQREHAEQKEEN